MGLDGVLSLGTGIYGAYQSAQQQKKANQLQQQALQMAQADHDARAPFRNLGLQQLGHAEQPMALGNLSYNPTNPFAAARGPLPSVATMTGTANNTFTAAPETVTPTDTANAKLSQVYGAMANNKALPAVVRQAAQAKLSGVTQLGAPTTYGWSK